MNPEIKKLRKELHQYPELSGAEVNTAKRVQNFLEAHSNPQIIKNIGGYGLAAIYEYAEDGPVIAIRCELDALPIEEENTFEYQSLNQGISHKCGHDGHITMVAGLCFWLKKQYFKSGKIVLLFQPAEETGKGAFEVLRDEKFRNLRIDYLFALHNIPGAPLHSIITMNKNFSAEVQSLAIYLKGKEAHAAEPEKGINPALGISDLTAALSELNVSDPNDENFTILTPIYMNLGQKSYGISPGHGEMHYTIRTWTSEAMKAVKAKLQSLVEEKCKVYQLAYHIDWFEYFPTSENDPECNQQIIQAAKANHFELIERPYPFKFGEDFGWFSKDYKTAMFGIGAGLETPALHQPDYDFPEEILATGINMFQSIIQHLMQK